MNLNSRLIVSNLSGLSSHYLANLYGIKVHTVTGWTRKHELYQTWLDNNEICDVRGQDQAPNDSVLKYMKEHRIKSFIIYSDSVMTKLDEKFLKEPILLRSEPPVILSVSDESILTDTMKLLVSRVDRLLKTLEKPKNEYMTVGEWVKKNQLTNYDLNAYEVGKEASKLARAGHIAILTTDDGSKRTYPAEIIHDAFFAVAERNTAT